MSAAEIIKKIYVIQEYIGGAIDYWYDWEFNKDYDRASDMMLSLRKEYPEVLKHHWRIILRETIETVIAQSGPED